jgi:hypothetical protein
MANSECKLIINVCMTLIHKKNREKIKVKITILDNTITVGILQCNPIQSAIL